MQELNLRVIAKPGVAATPVVEDFDVVEQIGDRFHSHRVARPVHRTFFRLLQKLSVGALSQQLHLRLIEQTMPDSVACGALGYRFRA